MKRIWILLEALTDVHPTNNGEWGKPYGISPKALLRSQMDDNAVADIRLALSQSQPLGNSRFSDAICAATGIRRTQSRRGRPAGKADDGNRAGTQNDFGF